MDKMGSSNLSAFIFNSEKKFWNQGLGIFQEEPIEVPFYVNVQRYLIAAANTDDTADVIRFDENERSAALALIKSIDMTQARLDSVREMNRDFLILTM